LEFYKADDIDFGSEHVSFEVEGFVAESCRGFGAAGWGMAGM
jgi:hypothetical protein